MPTDIAKLYAAIEGATPGQNPFSDEQQDILVDAQARGTLAVVLFESPPLHSILTGVLDDPRYQSALADQADAWRALLKTETSGAAYAAGKRRWVGRQSAAVTTTDERTLRSQIYRFKAEAEALESKGEKEEAAEKYFEAAGMAQGLAWDYRFQYLVVDVVVWNLQNEATEYFKIKRPASSGEAENFFFLSRLFLDKASENSPELKSLFEVNSSFLWKIVEAYASGQVEEAMGLLDKLIKRNYLISPDDHLLLKDLSAVLQLEKLYRRAETDIGSKRASVYLAHLVDAQRALAIFISETRPEFFERHSGFQDRLMGSVFGKMRDLVAGIIDNRAYPALLDWHNFFVAYEKELNFLGERASETDRILASYWKLRFGRIFYVRLKRATFRQEHLQELDGLIPKLKGLSAGRMISAKWVDDALDFRGRLTTHLQDKQPIDLFPPPPDRNDIRKTLGELINLGEKMKRARNMMAAKQDELTLLLASHPDLLNAVMRFADVLPEIENDPKEVVGHFREYFPKPDDRLPSYMNRAIRMAHWNMSFPLPRRERVGERVGERVATGSPAPSPPPLKGGGKWSDQVIAWGIKKAVRMMAYRYLAAENPKEAAKDFIRMAKKGMGVIGDILGEAVTHDGEADAYRDSYLKLIDELTQNKKLIELSRKNRQKKYSVPVFAEKHQADIQLAIKFSALCPYSQWNSADPVGTSKIVKQRFRTILDKILQTEKERGVKIRITVDPEEYEFRDMGNQIFKEVLMEDKYRQMENVGMGIQLYLRDSLDVLRDLIAWSEARGGSIPIRPIKGAYWDAENLVSAQKGYPLPVWPEKWMTDANFVKGIDLALNNPHAVRVAVGSHNPASIAYAISEARRKNVPIEIQMLYGMADDTKQALVAMGVPVSVYSPIGKLLPGMAYLARRILENSSQNSFLLQKSAGQVDIQTLVDEMFNRREKVLWPPPDLPSETPSPFGERVGVRGSDGGLDDPFNNEPLTDFSRKAHREKVRKYLVPSPSTGEEPVLSLSKDQGEGDSGFPAYPLLIGGQEVKTYEGFSRRDPGTGHILGIIAKAGKEEVKAAVDSASNSLQDWKNLGVRHRASILLLAAGMMRAQKAQLTAIMMKESGKPVREADADVAEAIDFLEYYAREAVRIFENNPDLKLSPKGVAAIIAPWNFPLAILTGMSAASLVMGNTVVLKPAQPSPIIAHYLASIYLAAGKAYASQNTDIKVPDGFVNYIAGKGTGNLLREHEAVKLVAFTGSAEVGLKIYQEDTPRGVKVIAEMGGKNALIVDRDAHPDDVIKFVLYSKFGYAGQKCSALDRLIIVGGEKHFRTMVDRLVAAAQSLKVGPTEDFGNFYGPVIDQESYDRLMGLIASVETSGGNKLLLDGRKHSEMPKTGYFIGPTIFEVTDPNHPLFQEETFGPILTVTRASNLNEAILLAKNSKFNLTGGAITRSPANREYLQEHWTEVGNLYIDRHQTGAVVDRQPFGGNNLSGIGGSKAGGRDYLWQFVNVQRKHKFPSPSTGEEPVLSLSKDQGEGDFARIFAKVGQAVRKKIENPEIYQPDLLGETNKVIYRPRGHGWIIIGKDTSMAEAASLLSAAVYAGNDVLISAVPSKGREMETLVRFAKEQIQGKVEIYTSVIAEDSHLWGELAKNEGIKWIAFGGKNQVNRRIVDAATKPRLGQNFVRVIIAEDPLAFFQTYGGVNPGIFTGMTLPQTVTINTARHGFDAKSSIPPPGGGTRVKLVSSSSSSPVTLVGSAGDSDKTPVTAPRNKGGRQGAQRGRGRTTVFAPTSPLSPARVPTLIH